MRSWAATVPGRGASASGPWRGRTISAVPSSGIEDGVRLESGDGLVAAPRGRPDLDVGTVLRYAAWGGTVPVAFGQSVSDGTPIFLTRRVGPWRPPAVTVDLAARCHGRRGPSPRRRGRCSPQTEPADPVPGRRGRLWRRPGRGRSRAEPSRSTSDGPAGRRTRSRIVSICPTGSSRRLGSERVPPMRLNAAAGAMVAAGRPWNHEIAEAARAGSRRSGRPL